MWHLYTIFLFTASDFKTTVVPLTILGTFNALSGNVLSPAPRSPVLVILDRSPFVFFWVWINCLPFNINNQRRAKATLEDSINKPWRPMPSKRISPEWAFRLMLVAYAASFAFSWYPGAMLPSVLLMVGSYSYNDLGGADASCILKNLHNACMYVSGATGATMVASGGNTFSHVAWTWLGLIGLTIFLTVHMQDMADQAGDRLRGRNTVPLVIGDAAARWSVAATMTACSFLLPAFWQLGPLGYAPSLAIGALVIARLLSRRTVRDDELTWKIWNLWLSSVYLLPFIKSLDGAGSSQAAAFSI